MLSHSSSVQHSSGTLSLHTCKTITCHRKFKKNIEAHWSAHKYSTSVAYCHEVFPDEPCPITNYTHIVQLVTLFYAFSSLPSTSFSSIFCSSSSSSPSSSSLFLPFFYFIFCSKFCVGIVVCHFRWCCLWRPPRPGFSPCWGILSINIMIISIPARCGSARRQSRSSSAQ